MKHCVNKAYGRNAKSKNPVRNISISIPERILERIDDLVGYIHASRSALILHHLYNGLYEDEQYKAWLETRPSTPKSTMEGNTEIFIDAKGRKWWVGEPEEIIPLGRADGYIRPSETKGGD